MPEIRHVPHGGRSYFSAQGLDSHEIVVNEQPAVLVNAIYKVFRPECCAWCFHYDLGKTLRVSLKLAGQNKSSGVLGRCCTEECARLYMNNSATLIQILMKLGNVQDFAQEDMLRFCCSAMALCQDDPVGYDSMLKLQDGTELFDADDKQTARLISAKLEQKFPAWGEKYSIPEIVYDAMSRSRVNCFGIWEQHDGHSFAESEQLGWALYPQSSFFNHACTPNIAKLRLGRAMQLTTMRAIAAGEELTISYLGDREFATTAERRAAIRDWGFDCNCKQCQEECASQA